MLSKIIAGLMIATAIATSAGPIMAAPKREVNPRLLALSKSQLNCPEDRSENNEGPPWCYKFAAVVDIDSGYLRVWNWDEEGNKFVVGKLYKGNLVYVRSVTKWKGTYFAGFTYLRPGCMSGGCFGYIDMAYLR